MCGQARQDNLLRVKWELPVGQCGTSSSKAMDIETRSGAQGRWGGGVRQQAREREPHWRQ